MTSDDRFIQAIERRKEAVAQSGSSSGLRRLELQNEANEAGPVELVGRAVSSVNALAGIHQWYDRKTIPADPNFSLDQHKAELYAGVPGQYQHKFNGVRSLAEGRELKSDILNEMHDLQMLHHAGAKGFGAMALAGIVDINLPLILLSEGTYLGGKVSASAAKAGIQGTRTANILKGGAAGLEAGVLTEGVNAVLRPTGEWTDIPIAGLSGLTFGSAIGGITPTEQALNKGLANTRKSFEEAVVAGDAGLHDFKSPVMTNDTVFNMSVDQPVLRQESPDVGLGDDIYLQAISKTGYDPTTWRVISEDGDRLTVVRVDGSAQRVIPRSAIYAKKDTVFNMETSAARTQPEQETSLDTLEFRSDIPNEDWLNTKRRYAEEDAEKYGTPSAKKLLTNATTGSFRKPVVLPTSILRDLPGANDEHLIANNPKLPPLIDSISKHGFDADNPILVGVNQRGEAYILEGNNRVRAAAETGVAEIPVEIRYFNGGERESGILSPEKVVALSNGSFGKGSVGAAQTKGSTAGIRSPEDPDFDPELLQDRVLKMREDARTYLEENDIDFQKEVAFPDTKAGRAAKRFYEFIQKTPLATDADILLNSKSPIAQALGYKLLENPVGITRNNRSGAMLYNVYFAQVAAPVNTNYSKSFDLWTKDMGIDEPGPLRHFNSDLRNQFDQEVLTELQYRYHDGMSNPDVSPAVKELVDRIDESSNKALKILQGEIDEISVKGSEDLTPESGWFRQLWRGDKIADIIESAPPGQRKAMRTNIEKALVSSYRRVYPGLDKDLATKYAKAVLRRASARERGIDTNLARMLSEEGRDFLEETLVDNGFSKADAAKFIDGIKGVNADKNKEGILKRRKDVDLRTKIEGTDYRLMDLVDSDIVGVWTKYARKVAGSSAMARHGIQKADKRDIINAILADQKAAGGNTISKDTLEAVFSYFDGGAFAGGINPWMRRVLQTTNLSLLNGLGLTQMAETGVQVAAVGWEAFSKTASKEVRDMLDGKNAPAMEELKGWTAMIDGDHRVFMDHLMLDEMRKDPGIATELGNWMDGMLIKGRHIQGYVSGFYKVKQLQQRVAVRSMLYRLAQHFEGGKELGYARLRDLGMDGEVEHRIGNYFTQGIVEMSPDGDVLKLNLDKWNQRDVMDFAAVLNRHADQVVQRAARGETSAWMHKDVGSLLMHLKSFTLLAMQKQLLRNARIMDAETTMGFIYSMLTAGTVYTAQQVISGRDQNLTPDKIMRGSVMLSNMTGWLPQWSDPIMSMLGMDDLRFSHYGARGVGGDVVGVPPALPTVNRIAHIPEATRDVLSGDYSNEDIYALQATPIIGNLYGFSYMFNEMKK